MPAMSALRPRLRQLARPAAARTYASVPPPQLAKPTRFAPPSHSSRKPLADPVNYPGPAIKQDPLKHYPETLPPPGTWARYILTSRQLHFFLSLGVLTGLAGTMAVANFLKTSPHAGDIDWSWSHPIAASRRFVAAYKLEAEDESRRTAERRKKLVDDVEKRGEYRRAHGLEKTGDQGGFGGFGTKPRGEDAKEKVMLEAARLHLIAEEERQKNATPVADAAWVEAAVRKVEEEAARASK